ncbi:thioesterase [Pseudomonas aeruginosa]|nr:thioesterase [Pseudomonas aeruginosa]
MSLWRQTPDLEQLNASQKNSIGDLLGIRFEAFDDESLTASMPVDSRTHQPFGLLHGGASVVLAESLGSMASYLCVDTSQYYCVGLEVNANHLRGLRSGRSLRWPGRSTWGVPPMSGTSASVATTASRAASPA